VPNTLFVEIKWYNVKNMYIYYIKKYYKKLSPAGRKYS